MGKFIELIDDDNQSVLINTDWIIYIEEDTKDLVIVYWGVPLSNGQGSMILIHEPFFLQNMVMGKVSL